MDRPIAFQLDPDTGYLTNPLGQALCRAIEHAGFHVWFVGGCVRNAVMGTAASDVDLCTDALPEQIIQIVETAGFRAVPTGVEHGTVTVVIDGTGFEVTTLRRDVETDGRRAVVAFSMDIVDDARRRDFTMNALYSDRHGQVYDPINGLQDAFARRVRFIEDPAARIREDYLRILRFFRFNAYYAAPDGAWDPDALAGIAATLDGLETLSAERVGAEMVKLLSAPNPNPALAVMERVGVLGRILPGSVTTWIGPVIHLEELAGASPCPMTRLAALGGEDVAKRLRLSRIQAKTVESIHKFSASTLGLKALGHEAGLAVGLGAALLRSAMANTPISPNLMQAIEVGANTKFPVSSRDLKNLSGPALGKRLQAIKQEWLASDLSLSRESLLGR